MNLLIYLLVIVVIIALLVWACDSIPMPPPVNVIVRVAIILIGVVLIAQKIRTL